MHCSAKTHHILHFLTEKFIECHSDDIDDACRCKDAEEGNCVENIKDGRISLI